MILLDKLPILSDNKTMKICTKCHIEKTADSFYHHCKEADGLRKHCKSCVDDAARKYSKANASKIKEISRIYRETHKEKLCENAMKNYRRYKEENSEKFQEQRLEAARRWREKNPDKAREATKRWERDNPEKAKESQRRTKEKHAEQNRAYMKRHREENREKILEHERLKRLADPQKYRDKVREWAKANPEKHLATKKASIKKNWEKLQAGHAKYCHDRRTRDPLFKLITNIRSTINRAIGRNSRGGRAVALLGCSIADLKQHLESQFKPGMSWENWTLYGWHIDHRSPIVSFDLTDPTQQKQCFNYSNLQPLWALDNLKKKDKILDGMTQEQMVKAMGG